MARHGVDFKTVKQAALKLLSKGISPSVQRIRELLGTGSNSTIAEHLKVWREQHAAKKVHHLPASIPEELVNTFETLWQTAMEHAEKQLIDVKEALESQEEKLQQEKLISDRAIADLKTQLDSLTQKIDEKNLENQTLQTNLAITTERLQNQSNEINKIEDQNKQRLDHLHNEKHQLLDQLNKLESELSKSQKELSLQIEKNQLMIAQERTLQEESEKRWVQLIDQARSETKISKKKSDEIIKKQNAQIDELKNNLKDYQDQSIALHLALDHKKEAIVTLQKQLENSQSQYVLVSKELAILQSKLKSREKQKVKEPV